MTRSPILVLAAALAACGHSAPTTLHTLAVVAPPAQQAYAGPPLRVEAVALPAALDRLELLDATGPDSFTVAEFDRWAAPPSRLARQTLTDDLTLRLPPGTVAVAGAPGPVEAIAVEVLAFVPGPAAATMRANWTYGCRPGTASQRGTAELAASPGTPPVALAALIGQLADTIAATLTSVPADACRPPAPAAKPKAKS